MASRIGSTVSAVTTLESKHSTESSTRSGWSRWEGVRGGRIWVGEDGSKTYYVRKKIKGTPYQSRLVGDDPLSLADQVRRFWTDPAGFDPRGIRPDAAVHLNTELIDVYLGWCAKPPPGRTWARSDPKWIAEKRKHLEWWAKKLATRDLRRVELWELKRHLKEPQLQTAHHRHQAPLHVLARRGPGQRRRGSDVRRAEDPSFEPAQWEESKAEFTAQNFEAVVAWLNQQWRRGAVEPPHGDTLDVGDAAKYVGLSRTTLSAYHARGLVKSIGRGVRLRLSRADLDAYLSAQRPGAPRRVALAHVILAGTAWHVTEVVRFSRRGHMDELPPTHHRQHGAVAALVCEHKGRFRHPTAVTQRVAEAAVELLKAGGVSVEEIYRWTKKAVEATGVPKFAPGQYRHTVMTHAGNQRTPDSAISKYAGHKTETTAKRFYTTRQVPPKIPTFS